MKYSSGAADCGKVTRLPTGHAARSREPAGQGKPRAQSYRTSFGRERERMSNLKKKDQDSEEGE